MAKDYKDWTYESHGGKLRAEVKYDSNRHEWNISVYVNGEYYAPFGASPIDTKESIIARIERAYKSCLEGKGHYDWYTGQPNFNKKPIRSKSEWGSYRYDGEADMKVLRKRAEGAVRYFNNGGKPRVEMQTHVFGYPFSIIDNGKLADVERAYKGNVIIRALSYGGGIYEGKVTLSYNDDYNDGRGQGGSGCVLIGDVKDVRIENGYLVISGVDLGKKISYRYKIQEKPDDKKVVFPIPKGGKVPDEKPVEPPRKDVPKKDIPKPKKEALKPTTKETPVSRKINGSMKEFCEVLHNILKIDEKHGYRYDFPLHPKEEGVIWPAELAVRLEHPDTANQTASILLDCYVSRYSEYWSGWSEYGITYMDWEAIEKRLREIRRNSPKPVPKPKTKSDGLNKDYILSYLKWTWADIIDHGKRIEVIPKDARYGGNSVFTVIFNNPEGSEIEIHRMKMGGIPGKSGYTQNIYNVSTRDAFLKEIGIMGKAVQKFNRETPQKPPIPLKPVKPKKEAPKNPVTPTEFRHLIDFDWMETRVTDINATATLKKFPTIRVLSVVFPKPGDETMEFGTFVSDGIMTDLEWKKIKNDTQAFARECDKSIEAFKKWSAKMLKMSDDGTGKPKPKPTVKPTKPVKPKEKPRVKPEKPKEKPKKEAPKPVKAKGGVQYSVRVNGDVKGTFSEKAKAERLKRDLKAQGMKVQIIVSFV